MDPANLNVRAQIIQWIKAFRKHVIAFNFYLFSLILFIISMQQAQHSPQQVVFAL